MISKRFHAVLRESAQEQQITGILIWDYNASDVTVTSHVIKLIKLKKPVLSRIYATEGFSVNDFEALPNAVVLASARDWRELLCLHPVEFDDPKFLLDVNFAVPLLD